MTARAARSLRDVRMADVAEVGGKAASLGELMAADVRVPDGVVLTVEGVGLPADERNRQIASAVESLGDGPFAVRSSGVAEDGAERSYAGMFETVLGVRTEDVVAATDRVLASGHSARVAGYEAAADGRMAVADPANDRAGRGRRCAHRRPDRRRPANLRRHRRPGDGGSTRLRRRRSEMSGRSATGPRPRGGTTEDAIDRRQALQVASEAVRIATARGVPQDVEWAIDADGALWILQARPMTALPPDVSWESPAPGAYTRMLRMGEWIARAGHAALRIVAADGDGRPHACVVPGADRPDRAQALPRRRQRLVLLLDQLHLRPRPASEPAGNARASRAHPSTPRGCDSAHGSIQLPGHGAHVARGHAAALSSRGRRRPNVDVERLPVAELPELDRRSGSRTPASTSGRSRP